MNKPAAKSAEAATSVTGEVAHLLAALGVPAARTGKGNRAVRSPITGEVVTHVADATHPEADAAIARSVATFHAWRTVPAPQRGALVRVFADELRAAKDDLGRLVTLEAGKIISEGLGEVQEMIDICEFAVGLSRQLHGLTMPSERANHRLMEQWHPMGPVGVISAFNFPVAVWSWNAALAFVCGDSVVWKPSEKTPLTALAVEALFARAAKKHGGVPDGLLEVLIGGRDIGAIIAEDPRLPIVSATGSTRMGGEIAPVIAKRFGRAILELGGNNGAIVCPSADLDLVVRAVSFSAMGTAGQRCTTLRRLFVHDSIYDALVPRLKKAFASAPVGDPREAGTLVGPLIDGGASDNMTKALDRAKGAGGTVSGGTRALTNRFPDATYVQPALVEMPKQDGPVLDETFAPILYVMRYRDFADAVAAHNAVPQGLSSAIFTADMREAEAFLSAAGSDCGIANVNMGSSGAEIGGAFGGEKTTGGGRESGADAWKGYMRRATNAINFGRDLPLAQGVKFDIG